MTKKDKIAPKELAPQRYTVPHMAENSRPAIREALRCYPVVQQRSMHACTIHQHESAIAHGTSERVYSPAALLRFLYKLSFFEFQGIIIMTPLGPSTLLLSSTFSILGSSLVINRKDVGFYLLHHHRNVRFMDFLVQRILEEPTCNFGRILC